ncbi:hypothetical protein NXS19_011382 [Fusarium pseudograminearum]|nr:hypothetical protein NXS19_011382 [Fusarium pseudograminearum]
MLAEQEQKNWFDLSIEESSNSSNIRYYLQGFYSSTFQHAPACSSMPLRVAQAYPLYKHCISVKQDNTVCCTFVMHHNERNMHRSYCHCHRYLAIKKPPSALSLGEREASKSFIAVHPEVSIFRATA